MDCLEESHFWGADTVFAGTTVSWVLDPIANQHCPGAVARVKSTAEPGGGLHFESATLHAGERFTFTPNVTGTWHYVDATNGEAARSS